MRKRVAAIVTEYRYHSHADVILGRLLGEFGYSSRLELVSMYTDQVPDNDMSREIARKYGIPISPTIAEAIQSGHHNGELNGVLIIGEQGNYPFNEKEQKLYPRKRFVQQTLDALDALGIKVPIFSDKHFSYDMRDAAWIYHQVKARNISFLGGSSIPWLEPYPSFDNKQLETVKEILVIGLKENEINGYHAMEVLQCLAEKRRGGETGIASIEAVEGEAVWATMKRQGQLEELMQHALSVQDPPVARHPMDHVKRPVLFTIHYADGTKGHVLQLEEYVKIWSFAFRNATSEVINARFNRSTYPYDHFERLTQRIEDMVISGQAPFPMERTYVTTGMINLAMESLYLKKAIDTPELLHVTYSAH
jgi:hypothetical protein